MSRIQEILRENPELKSRYNNPGTELFVEFKLNGMGTSYRLARDAVDRFKDRTEIQQFYDELVGFVKNEGNYDTVEGARRASDDIIGYCTGYLTADEQRIWFDTLPTISHPIYGRDPTFGVKSRVLEYQVVINKRDRKTVRAVFENLKYRLDIPPAILPTFSVYPLENMTEGEYAAFGLKLKHPGLLKEEDATCLIMFLTGLLSGLESFLSGEDIDVSLKLERIEEGPVS